MGRLVAYWLFSHTKINETREGRPRRCAHHYRTVRANMRTDQIIASIASTAAMIRLSHRAFRLHEPCIGAQTAVHAIESRRVERVDLWTYHPHAL